MVVVLQQLCLLLCPQLEQCVRIRASMGSSIVTPGFTTTPNQPLICATRYHNPSSLLVVNEGTSIRDIIVVLCAMKYCVRHER
ncbi:hypothetical protein BDN67DRAFT_969714 [Paxillus ammoniavirescens]|nr:hypothetical protein BDN67DRAFT_969714 [Paxillus ammoniavirescens]